MFERIPRKKCFYTIVYFFSLTCLSSCITEYEAKGLAENKDILVVEGLITEGETCITLSRSLNLTDKNPEAMMYVNNAVVFVECEDGSLLPADKYDPASGPRQGQYFIQIDRLNPEHQYRLKIEIDESKLVHNEYYSDYSYPLKTPEIDSIFWMKKEKGQPVIIYVSTNDPDNKTSYYRWSYKEDWEIRSDMRANKDFPHYPYYCWNYLNSKTLLIGSNEKTFSGQLTEIITEIEPTDRKLEVLYRINVQQNVISKQAYEYFANIKKNAQQTGSIFVPIPTEMRGNITCLTDPDKPVIGYVDVSFTTRKHLYIHNRSDWVYEFYRSYAKQSFDCDIMIWGGMYAESSIFWRYGGNFPQFMVPYLEISGVISYIHSKCVDCTNFGTINKPDDWPDIF